MSRKERIVKDYAESLLANPSIQECDSPDPDDIMGNVVAWDYDNRLAFIQRNRSDIIQALGVMDLRIIDGEPRVKEYPTFGTIRR